MTENTLAFQPLPSATEFAEVQPAFALAAAADEEFDEPIEIEAGPWYGPVFGPDHEPVAAGTTYPSLGGDQNFYRPVWRIPDRAKTMVAGPDIAFRKLDDGSIGFAWTVVDEPPAGAPAGAMSLAKSIDSVTVRWNTGSQKFPRPRLGRKMNARLREPWTVVTIGTTLLPDDARKLELAMSDPTSGCRLEIVHTSYYLIQQPEIAPRPPRIVIVADMYAERLDELNRFAVDTRYVEGFGNRWWIALIAEGDRPLAEVLMHSADVDWPSHDSLTEWMPQLGQELGEARFLEFSGLQGPRESAHTPQETQTIPFVFNPNDDAYRPIYRALHGAAALSAEWRQSSAGWLRDSGFPDTVYRLPDELRLAFDPDLGTPHVVITLHQDDAGRSSVRLLLRVAPWQNPHKILETRRLVNSDSARVIVGPVPKATVRLGGSFPEGVQVIGGEPALPLPQGGDLLLELSLEYFQLLANLLGSAVGLPGEVIVPLGDTASVPIPLSLRMDKVHDLPVAMDVTSPTSVRLRNTSGTAIRIGGCHGVLLQHDGTSTLPVAEYDARCTTAFPLELASGAAADLTFEPVGVSEDADWDTVLVELLDKSLVDDAKTLLLRANELAGSGELTWDLTISSPVFPALPAHWANLTSLEVEVSAPGYATTVAVLRADTPSRTLTMHKPLSALLAGGSEGIQTATYRVRNNYQDHQGQWTPLQQQSGEELIVYPNAAAGD